VCAFAVLHVLIVAIPKRSLVVVVVKIVIPLKNKIGTGLSVKSVVINVFLIQLIVACHQEENNYLLRKVVKY